MARLATIATGAALAAALIAVLALPGGSGDARPAASERPDGRLWVDGRAAACDDRRPAAAVSEARPWCTLEAAAAAAPDGTTVSVAPGDYGEVRFEGVDHGARVTLRAAGTPRPRLGYTVFDGASGLALAGFSFAAPVDIWPGENSRIGVLDSSFVGFRNVGVNVGPGARHVVIARNRFERLREEGEGAAGKGVNASGYGPEITDLEIVDNEFVETHGGGIAVAGVVDSLIEGNEISGVAPAPGSSIHADPLLIQGATRLTVSRNLIHENEQAIVIFDGVSGLRFTDNVVVRGQNYGVNFQGTAPGLRFEANTIWDNAFGGVLVQGTLGPEARLRNNLLQSIDGDGEVGGGEDFNLIGAGPRAGAHDLGGAPRFTAPAREDYSLAAGSRGIDAGSSEGTPRTDRLRRHRVDDPDVRNRGAGRRPYYDLGAEERGGR